jgi:hypothetical protein
MRLLLVPQVKKNNSSIVVFKPKFKVRILVLGLVG